MNETNKDRAWELASARVHNEASQAELNELDNNSDSETKQINEDVFDLHSRLSKAAPLHHGSLFHSWDIVANYLHKEKYRVYMKVFRYAAILLLAFSAGYIFNSNWKTINKEPLLFTEIVAPPGQMSEMTLHDGTRVWLNSGTKLRYSDRYGRESRKVELEGEAFFKVEPGNHPFRVQLKNNEVEVLHTSFAAMAYPDETFSQVTLVEGSVNINDWMGRRIKQLVPNQQIHIPDNPKEKIITRKVSTLFYESWINGQIKFDEERLADVTRRLERWYNVEIRLENEELANLRFTGTVLKNKPIDQSVKAMSMLLPIRITHQSNLEHKDVITISKK